jgi:hypothetical protein
VFGGTGYQWTRESTSPASLPQVGQIFKISDLHPNTPSTSFKVQGPTQYNSTPTLRYIKSHFHAQYKSSGTHYRSYHHRDSSSCIPDTIFRHPYQYLSSQYMIGGVKTCGAGVGCAWDKIIEGNTVLPLIADAPVWHFSRIILGTYYRDIILDTLSTHKYMSMWPGQSVFFKGKSA